MDVSVFFNPACDNCQTVKGILDERGIDADYVRYLDQAPTRDEIERVMGLLEIEDPQEMMRAKEPVYQELGLESAGREELIDAMTAHPILIQRPIVILGERAVIARPGERVRILLDGDEGSL
jgi:arsenate reductase (glutaredoxin)